MQRQMNYWFHYKVRLGCETKTKSMQEDDAGNYVGWLINMWVVMPLISMPL